MIGSALIALARRFGPHLLLACVPLFLLTPWMQSGAWFQRTWAPLLVAAVIYADLWDGGYPTRFWWYPAAGALATIIVGVGIANTGVLTLLAASVGLSVVLMWRLKEWVRRGKAPKGARHATMDSVWWGYLPFDGDVTTVQGKDRPLAIVSVKGRYARVRMITSQSQPPSRANRFVEIDSSTFSDGSKRSWLEVGAPPKRIPVGYLRKYAGVVGPPVLMPRTSRN